MTLDQRLKALKPGDVVKRENVPATVMAVMGDVVVCYVPPTAGLASAVYACCVSDVKLPDPPKAIPGETYRHISTGTYRYGSPKGQLRSSWAAETRQRYEDRADIDLTADWELVEEAQ